MYLDQPVNAMLTKVERERLENRDSNEFPLKIKKANEFIVRKKLKTWLSDITDVNFVLGKLPYKQLNKIITNEIIFSLMNLVTNMLITAGTPPINGDLVPSGNQVLQVQVDPAMKVRPSIRRGFVDILREPTAEERERADILKDHIKVLIGFLGDEDAEDIIQDAFDERPETKALFDFQIKHG
jgi:hypothetical protein